MDYMRYNGLSKSVIYQSYIPFTPYKAKLYYPKKNKYFSPKKMSRNEIIAIPKSYRFPLIKLNNSTSLSPIKVLTRSMSSTSSFSSNNYNTLSNISKKTINSKLTNSPNHRSIIQPTYSHRIYSPNIRPNNENIIYNLTSANANNYRNNAKVSVSPTNYNSIAMVRPNSIGYNKNFARVTPINCVNTTNISYSKVPINQSVRIITSKKENPVKKKYYIKSPRYTSNSIPILSTQKVTTYSNPQYTTYSTSQTYSNSTPILSTKQLVTNSNPQKTKISTPQISSSSNPILYTQKVTSNSIHNILRFPLLKLLLDLFQYYILKKLLVIQIHNIQHIQLLKFLQIQIQYYLQKKLLPTQRYKMIIFLLLKIILIIFQ